MISFLPGGSSSALWRSAYGFAVAIPLFAVSADSKSVESERFLKAMELRYEDVHLAQEGNQKSDSSGEKISGEKKTRNDRSENSGGKSPQSKRVLITEVIIEGTSDHPEKERLEFAAYDVMSIRPGSRVTREEIKLDLNAIYSTGLFRGVKIEPVDAPLGVQLVVNVQPNPLLTKVELESTFSELPKEALSEIFRKDFGKTLNLNILQTRMKQLKEWYLNKGYSLVRITGPSRVTSKGVVSLRVIEGTVAGVEVRFLNKEREIVDEKGNLIKGKTKPWVIKREISIKSGETFNRNQLEDDIKRLYSTSLFSDIKVTLKPVPGEPGKVIIVLGIIEQFTGSLTGGIGYSQSQGVFGQVGVQDSNLFGRSWNASLNVTYGQYGGLADLSFYDPWIRGDRYRTSFRTSLFLSREVPQIFQSQEGGTIRTASDYHEAISSNYVYDVGSDSHGQGKFNSVDEAKNNSPDKSWFDYEGDAVALQRTGARFVFSRPLNSGDPYKKVPWRVVAGMSIQKVKPIDFAGSSRPYGVSTNELKEGKVKDGEVICIAFNCARENSLLGVRAAAIYNKLNDARNPTSGNYISFGTEQFVSIGENSPTFNRARASYTHFVPVNLIKIAKGCRPKPGEKFDCPQAVGFQVKTGTIIGELPPYEAFCLGGANSVRGWNSCGLSVGRSFAEASVEYRFPIWRIVSGQLFVDGGTDLGSQSRVPGKPGKLLDKPGSGYSLGTGVIVTTPVGPLRLEAASQGLEGEWRFNLGVGWKF